MNHEETDKDDSSSDSRARGDLTNKAERKTKMIREMDKSLSTSYGSIEDTSVGCYYEIIFYSSYVILPDSLKVKFVSLLFTKSLRYQMLRNFEYC